MSVLGTGAFWAAALERAIKTFAQTLIATITLVGITAAEVQYIDWGGAFKVSAIAALLSVLSSVASAGVNHEGPSLATETVAPNIAPDGPVVQ